MCMCTSTPTRHSNQKEVKITSNSEMLFFATHVYSLVYIHTHIQVYSLVYIYSRTSVLPRYIYSHTRLIYKKMHANTHARTHERTHAHMHTHTHAHMHTRTHARTHVRAYARTYACMHTHTHNLTGRKFITQGMYRCSFHRHLRTFVCGRWGGGVGGWGRRHMFVWEWARDDCLLCACSLSSRYSQGGGGWGWEGTWRVCVYVCVCEAEIGLRCNMHISQQQLYAWEKTVCESCRIHVCQCDTVAHECDNPWRPTHSLDVTCRFHVTLMTWVSRDTLVWNDSRTCTHERDITWRLAHCLVTWMCHVTLMTWVSRDTWHGSHCYTSVTWLTLSQRRATWRDASPTVLMWRGCGMSHWWLYCDKTHVWHDSYVTWLTRCHTWIWHDSMHHILSWCQIDASCNTRDSNVPVIRVTCHVRVTWHVTVTCLDASYTVLMSHTLMNISLYTPKQVYAGELLPSTVRASVISVGVLVCLWMF